MANQRYEITAGPSKDDLTLALFEGKAIKFTFSELGEMEVSIWNIDTHNLAKWGFIEIRGSFKKDGMEHFFEGECNLNDTSRGDNAVEVTGKCKEIKTCGACEEEYSHRGRYEDGLCEDCVREEHDHGCAEANYLHDSENDLVSLHRGVTLSPGHPDYDET